MKKLFVLTSAFFLTFQIQAQQVKRHFEPVNFSKVNITDAFWKPKMEKVATATLQACIFQTEEKTGRIRNFEKTARKQGEKHEGIYYDDSDVYKALEAIAYSLKNKPDAALEKKADDWIDKIAAAQEPDGYLSTYYSLTDLSKRWTDMGMHEAYMGGHLIEAGVAYFDATGKRKLLDVATKWANHFDSLFGPNKRHWVTGHQELELALIKLYRITQDKKYVTLAHWLLEERGHGHGKGYIWDDWKDPAYAQDFVPVKDQKEITGHAVRAMYLYTGAADVAALTGDQAYMNAMKTVWQDVVFRNMYITGGIGASGRNEGFGLDYDLPNEQAYCETCASVGMVFWNQRMNLLTGESQYVDVLERSLYNGALDGLSLSGDHFFYGNPLASQGTHERREWFGTACCPSNIARLVASLGDYIYGNSDEAIWVNLFVESETNLPLTAGAVNLRQKTAYPWEGAVELSVSPEKQQKFALHLRIPGWAENSAAPGNLYDFTAEPTQKVTVLVNGNSVAFDRKSGYAVIERTWKKGDVVTFTLPMEVRTVKSRPELTYNQQRVAIQRGPLVYCVEGVDNGGQAWNFIMAPNPKFTINSFMVDQEPVMNIKSDAIRFRASNDGTEVVSEKATITAIPYYSWCNRGKTPMQVWLPTKVTDLKINNK
ncbi:glycoside hydrolase family 127 protein [Arundinibacter roseus]|uniref:Glycoside hydrolase family 127 protein n=1 Tax=Arundinibacter roseus TaxID=2070510 RepID=A0A4R4KBK0_9BACT|nr:beta-L-arabinofuranosidase domain-containing protein [Arundinibacter roseus]TDB65180.1 glycoside hydrolase family 127 protein [Arundinibacter roseus]